MPTWSRSNYPKHKCVRSYDSFGLCFGLCRKGFWINLSRHFMFSAYHYTNFDTTVSFVYMVTVGYHVNAIGQTQLIDQQIPPKGKCGHQQCSVKEYYINFIFQEISYAHLLFLDFPLFFFLLFIYLFKTFYAVVDGESFTEFCCSGKW